MATTQTKRTAKRKLSNIDFSSEDSHIALCHKDQGVANGAPYQLVIKASNFSPEFIEKASTVKVEMEITEFLKRFFWMDEVNAEILARTLGYTTAGQEKAMLELHEEALESKEPPEYPSWDSRPGDKEFEDYVMAKVQSFEIMKSLSTTDDISSALAKLSEDEWLALLQDQEMIEKAFKEIDTKQSVLKAKKSKAVKSTKNSGKTVRVSSTNSNVENQSEGNTSIVNKSNKENSMDDDDVKVKVEQLEKSLSESAQMLEKALAQVAEFQAKEKEAISKARKLELSNAVKNNENTEVIFKAIKDASDEDFQAAVKAIAGMQALIEKSALFSEQGVTVDSQEQVEESAVAKILKAQIKQ